MEGWQPVEEVVRWGFGQRPVVMANEAHDGLARSVRTRVIGARMIRAAHEAGARRLAMEALGWPGKDVPGPITALPDDTGGYLAQPEMRAMIGTALDLGWNFRELSGIDPFVIDQIVTVTFDDEPAPWKRELLDSLAGVLAAHGGTAAILRDQAPPPLDARCGVDAVIVSTDNALTGDRAENALTEDGA